MTTYADLIDDAAPAPKAMLTDKGYDSDAIRADLERRGKACHPNQIQP
jgi:hypothetical protein